MVDISALLKKPAGQGKRPVVLPRGDYPGFVKSLEYGESPRKKTPYVRFQLGVSGPPEAGMSEDETAALSTVDWSAKQLKVDFYLSDNAIFMLDDFIKSFGVESDGRGYDEIIPELIGRQVLIGVKTFVREGESEAGGNEVGKVVGVQ